MSDRIILVEDDPKLAKFIESELGFEGDRVTVAPNGLDGLTIARDAQPDILILDWMLPGISEFLFNVAIDWGSSTNNYVNSKR